MSVLFRGIEMPKSCWDCPFCLDFDFLDPYECAACMHDFEDGIDIFEHSRPDWCPLVPVPPHGRLIDADNIGLTNFEIILCQKGNPFKNALEMLLEKIESAPTIIPAEPPKEDES